MLEPRLSELISELFVSDPNAKDLFAGEILESLEMDFAWEDNNQGLPIADDRYSPFVGFTRFLKPNLDRQQRLHNFDVYLTATLVRLLDTRNSFFLALWREGSAGGPYVNVVKKEERYEVSLLSNYRMLERRENWFAAALSLFEWHSADADFFGVKLYRKAWSLDNDPVDIASAISLVVTYVLDALAGGGALIQIPQLRDEVLEQPTKSGQLWPVVDDASDGWRMIAKADSNGYHPPVSGNRGSMDSVIAQFNLRDAIEIASRNDDENGVNTLTQVLEDVVLRDQLFKPVFGKLHEFISLSHHLESIRILPEDHPLFEDFGSGEELGEDYDFDDVGESDSGYLTVSPDTSSQAQNPQTSSQIDEPDHTAPRNEINIPHPDSPGIYVGTNDALWELHDVFNGKVLTTPERAEDHAYLLAYLLGSYLRAISGFSELHDVKVFAPAFEAREQFNGINFFALADGDHNPTVLNENGVYEGVVERMQERAAKVFTTLLKIRDIDELEERTKFINGLPDETLMDCKIWSMVKNWGNSPVDPPRSVFVLIEQLAKRPRI